MAVSHTYQGFKGIGTGSEDPAIALSDATTQTAVVIGIDGADSGKFKIFATTNNPSTVSGAQFGIDPSTNGHIFLTPNGSGTVDITNANIISGTATFTSATIGGITLAAGVISTPNTALTINSGTGTLSISNDAAATTVNIATGAGVKTTTLGSNNSTSFTSIQSGSSGISLSSVNGPITANSGTGTVSISTDAANTTVLLGTGAGVKALTIGSTNTTSATLIQSGSTGIQINATNGPTTINSGTGTTSIASDNTTSTVNVGTGSGIKTVTLGSTNSTSATTVQSGSGALHITSTSGVITMNCGTSTINISTDSTSTTFNCGTGSGAKLCTFGSQGLGATTTLQSGNGGITINSGGGTSPGSLVINSNGGVIDISNDAAVNTVNIGTGAAQKVVNIGSTSSGSEVIMSSGFTVFNTGINKNSTQPAFLVYQSTSPTNVTGDGTAYTLALDTVVTDQGSNFNTSTHTYVTPVLGFYQFQFSVILTNVLVGTTFQMLINAAGTEYNGFYINPVSAAAAGGFVGASMSTAVHLAASANVTFVIQVTGGTKTIGIDGAQTLTFASGFLVC